VPRRTRVLLARLSLPALDAFDNIAIGIFHHSNGGPGPDGGFGPPEGHVLGFQPSEELIKAMPLLGSHLHLREDEHLGIRERGDRWGLDRGCAGWGEDQRQRLGQELRHLPTGMPALMFQPLPRSQGVSAHGHVCKPFVHNCWLIRHERWPKGSCIRTDRWPTHARVCMLEGYCAQAATPMAEMPQPVTSILPPHPP
jgi:hypothetical protein